MINYLTMLFSVIAIIFCFLYSIFILDSILTNISIKYIDVSSSKKATKIIKDILNELDLGKAVFFDLGSGRGAFSIRIKRLFPQMQVYGFDRSPFKIYLSRVRAFLAGQKVVFVRKNILNVNLSEADIVYTYIWPTTMVKLKEKFEKELKPGSLVIASTFPVPGWEPVLTKETLMIKKDPGFERIYVYKR
jgi:SAM-dependent methyltransferase